MHSSGRHINSPTSGMSSVARMTLRYSVTAKSINASSEHISASIVWYISDVRGFNNQALSMHPCGRHINSNLGYVICSSYINMLLNLCQAQCPLQNTYFDYIVWCICACERFSQQTSSMHAYRQHINSNLGYAICSVHSNLIMIDLGNVLAQYFDTILCV